MQKGEIGRLAEELWATGRQDPSLPRLPPRPFSLYFPGAARSRDWAEAVPRAGSTAGITDCPSAG